MTNIIDVENKMITLRNQQVILDSDVAKLYGVQTKKSIKLLRTIPGNSLRDTYFNLTANKLPL